MWDHVPPPHPFLRPGGLTGILQRIGGYLLIEFERKSSEPFLEYADRLISGRNNGIYDLDKNEIYQLLYGDNVSSDHARKTLRTLEMTLEEVMKDKANRIIHKDLNDKDLDDKDLKIPQKETVEIHSDGRQTSEKLIKMSNEQSKDVEFLLRAHGFNPDVWELVSARNNIWNICSKIYHVLS